MTRINVIDPKDLTNEWLIAEHRELPRIPNTILSGKARVILKDIPDKYKLGAGHVKFFYNKLKYLEKRHQLLCEEIDRRGIKRNPEVCVDLSTLCFMMKSVLYKDWCPEKEDYSLNIERLQERFNLRKKAYHFTNNEQVKLKLDSDEDFHDYHLKHLKHYS